MMRSKLVTIIILGAFCAYMTNGFLLGKKFKNACDPDPCKNKAKCILDTKNQNISTCTCPEGFHGKHCELKTGCYSKPCRKGTCKNDPKDLSNFTCTCNAGFVGPKCDTADACLKNPCKQGKCSLDAKLKPVCSCPNGWMSKNCDKRNCTIFEFKGKNYEKTPKIWVDKAIEKKMQDLDGLAKICGVRIKSSRSFTLQPDPKVIPESKDMAHTTGRGFCFELNDEKGKLLCNSICLGKTPIPQKGAKCLIDGMHAIGWKHSILNPGCINDGSHIGNLNAFNELREHHQVGCKDNKF